jgi:hypothetical protein
MLAAQERIKKAHTVPHAPTAGAGKLINHFNAISKGFMNERRESRINPNLVA